MEHITKKITAGKEKLNARLDMMLCAADNESIEFYYQEVLACVDYLHEFSLNITNIMNEDEEELENDS